MSNPKKRSFEITVFRLKVENIIKFLLGDRTMAFYVATVGTYVSFCSICTIPLQWVFVAIYCFLLCQVMLKDCAIC